MAKEIFIARHGQNEDNLNGILNGHRDLPLTDLGRQQAEDLALGIQKVGLEFEVVYSSPLVRAFETAKIIIDFLGLEIKPVVLPELIERDFGIMTGQKIEDVEKLCAPDILKTSSITYMLSPEGSEQFPELLDRGRRALDVIRSDQHKSALAVCHGDIGKMMYAAATGMGWEDVLRGFHFGNCELIDIAKVEAHVINLPQQNL